MSKTNQANTIDPREFRNACGRFATGITIVTTEVDGEVHGMTANAFMSVSLDPPLVVVSVDKRANMHQLIPQSGRYGVSILSKDQEAHSTHFAGRPDENLDIQFERHNDQPLLVGATAQFATRLYASHDVGDHTLYVGEVEYMTHNEEDPILYYCGRYRQLGE